MSGDPPTTDRPDEEEFRAAEVESRYEAAPAVLVLVIAHASTAIASKTGGWTLERLPWWSWLVLAAPEAALLLALSWSRPRRRLEVLGLRREVSIILLTIISIGNGVMLIALIASVLGGHELNGRDLLWKGGAVWSTNVITFGLLFWEFDRGGPVRRREPDPPLPDFQFPQMENPQLAEPGWQPRLFDYMYVSFTNAIAFSPTDAMPMTRWAKALMLTESAASSITVLVVAARAVNILR
ncbi:MAG TPA: hypothetical protein VFH74_09435 [Gaiellales bacterium]|nr:hypothetical protein [Gaiellales bacterium]